MANTIRIKGLKKIAGESKSLSGYYSGQYLQVNYDRATGEAWTDFHCSFGQNSWSQYHDNNIINCGNISEPTTMVQIRDMIEGALSHAV